MVRWKDAREHLLADPEVRAYCDSLAPLYALIAQAVNRRLELNMSQQDLAARMNTTQSVVSRIECGAIENVTVRTLNRMADARRWRTAIEGKFQTYPFAVVFSGAQPQSVVLSYDEFGRLRERAARAGELEVKVETLSRLSAHASSKSATIALPEMVAEMGVSLAELEAGPDVDLDDE